MFNKLLYDLLFIIIELIFVAVLSYFVFMFFEITVEIFWAIVGIGMIFYFCGKIFASSIRQLRKKIYAKIIDKEQI